MSEEIKVFLIVASAATVGALTGNMIWFWVLSPLLGRIQVWRFRKKYIGPLDTSKIRITNQEELEKALGLFHSRNTQPEMFTQHGDCCKELELGDD